MNEEGRRNVIHQFLKNHFPHPVTQNSMRYYVGQGVAQGVISQNQKNFILRELKNVRKFPITTRNVPRSTQNLPFGVTGGYQRKSNTQIVRNLLNYATRHRNRREQPNIVNKKTSALLALKQTPIPSNLYQNIFKRGKMQNVNLNTYWR